MAGSGILSNAKPIRLKTQTPNHGELGEVKDLRRDVEKALAPLANITVEEFTNPPAASAAGLRIATATVASIATVLGAALLLGGVLPFARQITFTTAGVTPADAPANVVITGTDIDGKVQSETLSLAQTAALVASVKAYKTVTSLVFPAADGVAATVSVGWAAPLGLTQSPVVRAGAAFTVLEVSAGTRVTTGTLTDASTNPPHGLYTPAAAANGTNDYAVFFESVPAT